MSGIQFQSTYQEDFSSCRILPPLFETPPPSTPTQDRVKLQLKCMNITRPTFPHGKRESDIPIALGFNTLAHRLKSVSIQPILTKLKKNSAEKSETPKCNESSRPNSTSDLPQVIIEELVKLGHYTSSSQNASYLIQQNKEFKKLPLPKNILQRTERNGIDSSGRVLGKAQEKPELWQTVGCFWDKLQERRPTGLSQSARPISKQTTTRLLHRPRIGEIKNKMLCTVDCTNKLSSNIPGYGGYQPRLPTNHKPENRTQTMSNVTYRKHSRITYRLPVYGHKAPMSRTVTLTEPYNPYNKIVEEEIKLD